MQRFFPTVVDIMALPRTTQGNQYVLINSGLPVKMAYGLCPAGSAGSASTAQPCEDFGRESSASIWGATIIAAKVVADSPVGQVLARPLFLKVKTKFHFIESK